MTSRRLPAVASRVFSPALRATATRWSDKTLRPRLQTSTTRWSGSAISAANWADILPPSPGATCARRPLRQSPAGGRSDLASCRIASASNTIAAARTSAPSLARSPDFLRTMIASEARPGGLNGPDGRRADCPALAPVESFRRRLEDVRAQDWPQLGAPSQSKPSGGGTPRQALLRPARASPWGEAMTASRPPGASEPGLVARWPHALRRPAARS